MRSLLILLIFGYFSLTSNAQIIADHTVVDQYDQIPQQWMDSVMTMLVDFAGESHSAAYRDGMELLEALDAAYQVTTYNGTRPAPSGDYVRLGGHGTVGEQDFFTSASAIAEYKTVITDQNETGNPYDVMAFGWCWDMDRDGSGGTVDPVYNVRWSGSTKGGPDGDMEWGLDADDVSLTGNSVTMDTYLDAVEQYQQLCTESGYSTTIVFTTGPVDMYGGSEEGFQREIKHDYIRKYVAADETRVLFDYADILCWNDADEQYMETWDDGGEDRDHANIHPDNLEGGYTAHIGNVGALRLGKAMWWMLARIAGWNPDNSSGVQVVDDELNPGIEVYVAKDYIRVNTPNDYNAGEIKLFDLQGRLLKNELVTGNSTELNTSSLYAGTYIIMITNGIYIESRKIVFTP